MGKKINTIVDVLERGEFIDQVIAIVQRLKANNQGMTFSVEGQWGIGKSFILDRVDEILGGEQDCLVLRYNCWEYDYYDEPLMAIVASFLDQLYSKGWKTEMLKLSARTAVDFMGSCLKEVVGQYVKDRLGVDLVELGKKEYEKALGREKADSAYDLLSGLKTALYCLRGLMVRVSGDKKLILLVDELDRCLPPYQIKILERLHHLFLGSNSIVIIAVNSEQLTETVKQLYGKNILVDKYLKKTLMFSLKLDCGTVSDTIMEKYNRVLENYKFNELASREDVVIFFKMLFAGIDIRTTEEIWERVQLVHSLVFSEEENRIDFLCFELLWLVMKEYKEDIYFVRDNKRDDGVYGVNLLAMKYDDAYIRPLIALPSSIHALFDWLVPARRYDSVDGLGRKRRDVFFPHCLNFKDFIVGYWCEAVDSKSFRFKYENTECNEAKAYERNIGKIKQFVVLSGMIE